MTRLLPLTILAAAVLPGQTADEIMARVAAHQDESVSTRTHYVYKQNLLIRIKRSNGKLAREETRDYVVTPGSKGVERKLVKLSGKIGQGKKTIDYDRPEFRYKNLDVDGELAQSFADDFGDDKRSKDGVSSDLFPLRSKNLNDYLFVLKGSEQLKGRDVWHIAFTPRHPSTDDDDGDSCMAGDAYIDRTEYQPLMISTHFVCKIPAAARVALGTNLKNLGFKVTYERFDDGVWFPVSYGGEMRFRVLFLYAREIGIGLINSDFQRAGATSSITYDPERRPEPNSN